MLLKEYILHYSICHCITICRSRSRTLLPGYCMTILNKDWPVELPRTKARSVTQVPPQPLFYFMCIKLNLNPVVNSGMLDIHATFSQHFLEFSVTDAIFAVQACRSQDDIAHENVDLLIDSYSVSLKMEKLVYHHRLFTKVPLILANFF